jgi:hypothetical protein
MYSDPNEPKKPNTLKAASLASVVLVFALILETIKSDFENPAPWREIVWRDWLFVTLFIIMIILGGCGLRRASAGHRRCVEDSKNEKK